MNKKTISTSKANFFSILLTLGITIPVLLIYYAIWGSIKLNDLKIDFLVIISFLIIILGSIVIHEGIHALFFAIFSKKKFKSVKIGVLWKTMTPYAHCEEPLLVKHYLLSVLMPGFLLGFLPMTIAFLIGSKLLLYYSLMMIMAAAGDFLIIGMLLKTPKNRKILDHENEMGFYVI